MYKIIRYIGSGLTATAMSLGVTYSLTEFAGFWYLYSSVAGFCVAVLVSFILQKFWTFRHREIEKLHREAGQFVMVALGGLVFNAAAVYMLAEFLHMHYLFAQLLAGVAIAMGNFVCYHMIFRGAARRSLSTLWREELSSWERSLVVAGALSLVLLALKSFGVDLLYHQDEWKTARVILEGAQAAGTFFHHPPLTEFIFRVAGEILPAQSFRLLPVFFTGLCFALLYLVVEARSGIRAGILAVALFGTVAYGSLSAVMLDTDGAILPFFFLLSVYLYDRLRASEGNKRYVWAPCLAAVLLAGSLVKLSFVLVIGALILDYLYSRRHDVKMREIWFLTGGLLLFAGIFCLMLAVAQSLYPAFDISAMRDHALSYVRSADRNWGQIAFQSIKAVMYIGPISFVWLAFTSRSALEQTRVFFIYLCLGFLFYFVLFDFSSGALDKYLMFTIVPVCALAASALAPYISRRSLMEASFLFPMVSVGAALLALNALPHRVLPLYPKSAWAAETLTLHWNILLPFMGGSGPAGFYVSFLFIAASFLVGVGIFLCAYFLESKRTVFAIAALALSFLYSAVLTEELYAGKINGSTKEVTRAALDFIQHTPDVTSVITHNDIGAYELWSLGKYAGRFYAVPQYESTHKELFAAHTGHFMVVDIPRWNDASYYAEYFGACTDVFASISGHITATVYECPKVR